MSHNPAFLYVEDEQFSRVVMEMLVVRAMGYKNFTVFPNSEHFIQRVEALSTVPDIIFLDIHMQPINGFEMLALLRQHPTYARTPIIALTASVMNEEVDTLKTSGFNGAIAKPIDQTIFPGLVAQILKGEEVWHIV